MFAQRQIYSLELVQSVARLIALIGRLLFAPVWLLRLQPFHAARVTCDNTQETRVPPAGEASEPLDMVDVCVRKTSELFWYDGVRLGNLFGDSKPHVRMTLEQRRGEMHGDGPQQSPAEHGTLPGPVEIDMDAARAENLLHADRHCIVRHPGKLTKRSSADGLSERFDICVYAATPSGIYATIAIAREGKRVLLVEPNRWMGGMLGAGIKPLKDCPLPAAGGWTDGRRAHDTRKQAG